MNARALVLCALTGCGGAPFLPDLGAPADDAPTATLDAGADAAPATSETAPPPRDDAPAAADAALDAGSPGLEAQAEAQTTDRDARTADARDELAMKGPPEDAGSNAPAESGACTPEPAGSGRCEGSATFVTPGSFCVGTYQGATPVGTATATPPACQCAGAFTCACVLAALPDVCPPAASAHCSDTSAGPSVTCL